MIAAGKALSALTMGVVMFEGGQRYGFGTTDYLIASGSDTGALFVGAYTGQLGAQGGSYLKGVGLGTTGYYIANYYVKKIKDSLTEIDKGGAK